MKNIFGLFIKKENRKMGFAVLLFFIFFIVNLVSLYQGIKIHQTWRIITAIAGALACAALCIVIVNMVNKGSKKETPVQPVKAGKRR